MKSVMAICSHPDDEVLGCGGTLARHVAAGDQVKVVVLCDNGSRDALLAALRVLGVRQFHRFLWLDQQLDSMPFLKIEKAIKSEIERHQPTVVYTHWHGDLNRDHRICAEAVHVATRPKTSKPIELLEFYCASSTEYTSPLTFVPDTWIDISQHIGQKQRAIAQYENQLQQPNLPRNEEGVRTVARFWGMQVGCPYAEVFRTARRIL